jgi:amidase
VLTPLTATTARSLAEKIRRRQYSAVEVVEAHLERIAAVNPELNAVVALAAEDARAAAVAADRAVRRGDRLGPLHGVPMTVKDSFDTAQVISTAGTLGRRSHRPERDATAVARLKAAGAILLGKTNTPEFTLGVETDNLVYGRTNNPWDPARTPGGSSGGSAAIVAAGGAAFDLGSDTGASIRLPAHFCGVAGIKPTSGRVPRTGHVMPAEGYLQSWTQLGPLARSVDDLALVLGVIAGPDWRDASAIGMPLRDPNRVKLDSLAVAWHDDNGIRAPTAAVAQAVTAATAALESAKVRVVNRRPADLAEGFELALRLYAADGGAWIKRLIDQAGTTEPSPATARAISGLSPLSSAELSALIERWDRWRGRMLSFLERFDAILCPPNAMPAPLHGGANSAEALPAFGYTFVFNLTGWPAAVVPAGRSPEGLPIGVQVVGRPWREDVVLAIAKRIETALGGYRPPPI